MDSIYSATYSQIPVYEFKLDGESIMRRRHDDWVNATHVLKAAGFDKPARTRILEREIQKGEHEKVQGGYGKYQGTWIPLQEARLLAERNNVLTKLAPIFDYVAGEHSPPPAPKHASASSKPRAPRKSKKDTAATTAAAAAAAVAAAEAFSVMGPPTLPRDQPTIPHEEYDMGAGFDDNESVEHTTLDSSSMMADEDAHLSQHGGRKRKRGTNQGPIMSVHEQEHVMYGDQLLDYFMTVGDAPQATRIHPPVPPTNFQIDRPIDDSGNTALHWACAMGDLQIVQDLLRRGATIFSLSIHEETPLVRAVLFTNNYEKRTFGALLDVLLDSVAFRDWFGATIFHHVAETTRSKGKWKSSKYYCDILLDKICNNLSSDEVDLLLACQDNNGDTAALVAARNGAFHLVNMLVAHCPRTMHLVNKKGETAGQIAQRSNIEAEAPVATSSIAMANDQIDGELTAPMPSDHMSIASQQVDSAANSDLLSKIGVIMADANKRLGLTYGDPQTSQRESTDIANPEALHRQLELDRDNIRKQMSILTHKEAEAPIDSELSVLGEAQIRYKSLVEHDHHSRLQTFLSASVLSTDSSSQEVETATEKYQITRRLLLAHSQRREAVIGLAQQTADAGVSTKFDVHRKLVTLATGLKEEELDPMASELAAELEFDRLNGKGPSNGRDDIEDGFFQ
ncbi:apses transcription factor [Penicillium verhagenii]|nr:apses transcription factor [Penicillium verhagenii]